LPYLSGVRLGRDQAIGSRIPSVAGLGNGRKGLGRNRAHLTVKGLLLGLWHILSSPYHGVAMSRPHLVQQTMSHQ